MRKDNDDALTGRNMRRASDSRDSGLVMINDLDPSDQVELYTHLGRSAANKGDHIGAMKYFGMIEIANNEAVGLKDVDTLTGVPKRATFEKDFYDAQERQGRSNTPFAVGIYDVDNFGDVNTEYGHIGGDDTLKEIANRVVKGKRKVDGFYRYGGDEFGGIFSDVDKEGGLLAISKAVGRVSKSTIYISDGRSVKASISAGVYVVGKEDSFEDAVKMADQAAYRSKEAGRNRASL